MPPQMASDPTMRAAEARLPNRPGCLRPSAGAAAGSPCFRIGCAAVAARSRARGPSSIRAGHAIDSVQRRDETTAAAGELAIEHLGPRRWLERSGVALGDHVAFAAGHARALERIGEATAELARRPLGHRATAMSSVRRSQPASKLHTCPRVRTCQ